MKITPAAPAPLALIDLVPKEDERGFFARSGCAEIYAAYGLPSHWPQSNVSYNRRAGTLRGLHGARRDAAEGKIVRCTAGAVWDVVVDARPESETFGHWAGFELTAANRRAVYVPVGFLHGFLTLTDDAELLYQMSAPYQPGAALGARWDDPALGIDWPAPPEVLSERDAALPTLAELLGAGALS